MSWSPEHERMLGERLVRMLRIMSRLSWRPTPVAALARELEVSPSTIRADAKFLERKRLFSVTILRGSTGGIVRGDPRQIARMLGLER